MTTDPRTDEARLKLRELHRKQDARLQRTLFFMLLPFTVTALIYAYKTFQLIFANQP